MARYIVKRLIVTIITFFGITIIVFFMANMAPGSPIDYLLSDPAMTAEEAARRAAQLGLDQPVYVQYFAWLGQLFKLNLGFSYRTYRSVSDMVFERLGNTVVLTGSSLILSYLIAIPIGIYSARKPYSIGDYGNAQFLCWNAAYLYIFRKVGVASHERYVFDKCKQVYDRFISPSCYAGAVFGRSTDW